MTLMMSCSANFFSCAGRPNCCAKSTCTRPAARDLKNRPNISGRCCRWLATAAAPAKPGPISTTGPSPACRGLFRAGSWRTGSLFRPSGALFRLGLLLHVGAQHGIDTALIALAFALEIVEHVFIDANGDRLFLRWDDQNGVRPVDIDGYSIRIVCDRLGNVLVRQRVEASPVSPALPAVAPLSRYDILFLHFSPRDALR